MTLPIFRSKTFNLRRLSFGACVGVEAAAAETAETVTFLLRFYSPECLTFSRCEIKSFFCVRDFALSSTVALSVRSLIARL